MACLCALDKKTDCGIDPGDTNRVAGIAARSQTTDGQSLPALSGSPSTALAGTTCRLIAHQGDDFQRSQGPLMTSLTAKQRGRTSSRNLDSEDTRSETLTDVDSLPALFPGQTPRFTQLGCGKFLSHIEYVRLGDLRCTRIRTHCDTLIQGSGPSTGVLFFLAPWTAWNWRARAPLGQSRVVVCGPGQEVELLAEAEVPGYAIVVEVQELFHDASGSPCAKLVELPPTGRSVCLPSRDFIAFEELLSELMSTRHAISRGPSLMGSIGDLQASLRAILRDLLNRAVNEREDRRSHAEQFGLVRESRELMERNPRSSITISEVCDQLCVSRRTLFYAFQEVMGLSPKAYLKIRRLNKARRELKSCDHSGSSVREILEQWGFRHSGQFAQTTGGSSMSSPPGPRTVPGRTRRLSVMVEGNHSDNR